MTEMSKSKSSRIEKGMKYFIIITKKPSYWGPETDNQIGMLLTSSPDDTSGRFLPCVTENKKQLMVDKNHIRELDQIDFDLLSAIENPETRLQVSNDAEWMREGRTLKEGSHVSVSGKRFPSDLQGVVRFKGYLPNKPGLENISGLYFGIELDAQFAGLGSSDGEFRGRYYFHTVVDGALFVPLNRIRDMDSDDGARSIAPGADYIRDLPVMVGDRVVLYDDVRTEAGVVRWLGFLPDDRKSDVMDRKINAGVEFDHPIGKGSGFYKQQRLFRAKPDHALLLPVLGLLKESEFHNQPVQPRDN
ncbi:hypothetical protein CAPTEDRAFT_221990 [Capitella teleta]|uniref:CAP-Gly domain-containing protein n=1 Tax=Capitella teleta TaxID=283909 RepID=R7UWJ7_CAPTE|nr:hypothetical protein CAPTEDRAFT_221990 [Capitella teleta]|eukprot:ELU08312.1 hypothetical protein CAPTEDRAFT_221990 [Capitella teleta]